MPIYLYECERCGVRFERLQHFSDAPLTECPECDGHVRRVIQPAGVIFKGSGFYVTDNRQVSSATLRPSKDNDKPAEPKPTGTEGIKPEQAPPAVEKPSEA